MKIEKHHNKLLWEDYTFLNQFEFYRDIEEARKDPETYTAYVPLLLNKKRITDKLWQLIGRLGDCDWRTEMEYSTETDKLIRQIEAYDEIVKLETGVEDVHSEEAVALVKEFVEILMQVPDGGSDTFPFAEILALSNEYGLGITEEDIY